MKKPFEVTLDRPGCSEITVVWAASKSSATAIAAKELGVEGCDLSALELNPAWLALEKTHAKINASANSALLKIEKARIARIQKVEELRQKRLAPLPRKYVG